MSCGNMLFTHVHRKAKRRKRKDEKTKAKRRKDESEKTKRRRRKNEKTKAKRRKDESEKTKDESEKTKAKRRKDESEKTKRRKTKAKRRKDESEKTLNSGLHVFVISLFRLRYFVMSPSLFRYVAFVISSFRLFAFVFSSFRYGAFVMSPRNNEKTKWHKSATIRYRILRHVYCVWSPTVGTTYSTVRLQIYVPSHNITEQGRMRRGGAVGLVPPHFQTWGHKCDCASTFGHTKCSNFPVFSYFVVKKCNFFLSSLY